MTAKFLGVAASLLGMTAVALGAFAAHALKSRLAAESLQVFKTGVDYQFLHAIALLAVAAWMLHRPHLLLSAAAWAFLLGILLFSGSLYLLVATGQRGWGAITPVGGVAFLVGWLLMACAAWSSGR